MQKRLEGKKTSGKVFVSGKTVPSGSGNGTLAELASCMSWYNP